MKKLLLSLIITINFILSPVAAASEYMSSNVNMPLLILTILAGLFIIEVLFYYHEISSRKENKNGKKTNIDITTMGNMPLLKIFDVALKTRNLEIELFWKRSNYFLVLNTAIAVGFFSLIEKVINMKLYIYALLFCVIGCFVCIAWLKVNLGSKFWQSYWEQILTEISSTMKLRYFAKSVKNKSRVMNNLESPESSTNPFEKYYNHLVLEKPSVSKWMTFLSFFFLLLWFCIGGFISYKIGKSTIGESALIIWIVFWVIIRVVFWLFNIIPNIMIRLIMTIIIVFYIYAVLYYLVL